MTTHVYKFINAETAGSSGNLEASVVTFNATTSWTGPSGGYYTQTILEATHNKGTDPVVQVFETIAGDDILVGLDAVTINSSGDIELQVTDNARFAGKIVIIGA